MMWSDGQGLIVELPSVLQDAIRSAIEGAIKDATGSKGDLVYRGAPRFEGHSGVLGAVEPLLGVLEPDSSFGPNSALVETVFPPWFRWLSFHTLKLEIGVSQGWGNDTEGHSLEFKADSWRQYPGLQYVLCVRVSSDVSERQWRLSSIVSGEYEAPRMGVSDVVPGTIVELDARRLLSFPLQKLYLIGRVRGGEGSGGVWRWNRCRLREGLRSRDKHGRVVIVA